ncbi:hypothetical protein DFJ73DRAFT_627954 [Zopfochytrium polystomum]|nr:hypothetical protein DFJ73DRAFT_627954 [Zopfochytrium polystomum]
MRFVSNIPDSDHVPYPVIEANPHIKTLVRYFRPSDYAVAGGIGVGFPLLFMLWGEREREKRERCRWTRSHGRWRWRWRAFC